MATLIEQAHILMASELGANGVGDVLIEAGQIVAIAPTLARPDNAEIIDGRGQFLGPGLIDLYSQSGELGNESRETHDSIRRAAAAGGFSRVGLLPNTQPAVDNVSAVAAVQKANYTESPDESDGKYLAKAQLMPWASITLGAAGDRLSELAELAEVGAIGFTDGQPLNNLALLRRLLEYAQPLNKTIALWPCDRALAGSGVAREGPEAIRLGLPGVSALAETTALATLLECVAQVPARVHIMRVSTARSVALIAQAKERGLPISASVAWHHLIFDTPSLAQYDPALRHDPPLGNPADRQALISGVADGVIDAIAIDHSPYTYEEKTVAFDQAPAGAIGLELALPVLWQTFVASGQWSPQQLWQCLSHQSAQCLGLAIYPLAVNQPAELTLFDPRLEWQVIPSNLQSLAINTPWANQTLTGKVTKIWIPGIADSLP
jgi:dihydroorotase